jgi:hypothetical protein
MYSADSSITSGYSLNVFPYVRIISGRERAVSESRQQVSVLNCYAAEYLFDVIAGMHLTVSLEQELDVTTGDGYDSVTQRAPRNGGA